MGYIQKLPKPFWIHKDLQEGNRLFWCKDGTFTPGTVEYHDFPTVQKELDYLKVFFEHQVTAIAGAYIDFDKQFEVIGFTEVGSFEQYAHMSGITMCIQRARELALTGKTNIQITGIKNPVNQVVRANGKCWTVSVRFCNYGTLYTYRTSEENTTGWVAIFSPVTNRVEVLQVVSKKEMTEAEIHAFAKSKGYDDLRYVEENNVPAPQKKIIVPKPVIVQKPEFEFPTQEATETKGDTDAWLNAMCL